MLNYLPPSLSSYSGDIDGIISLIYWIIAFWWILAEIVLVAFIFMGWRRRVTGQRAVWLPAGDMKTNMFVLGPVMAVILCDGVIETSASPIWDKVKLEMPEHADVEIKVTARQYMWLFTYPGLDNKLGTDDDIVANELHVPVGKKVVYHLESADVLHSFYLREARLKQDAVPGRLIPGWFDMNQEGTYEVACAEICGKGHTKMRAQMVVQSVEAYDAWYREQTGAGAN